MLSILHETKILIVIIFLVFFITQIETKLIKKSINVMSFRRNSGWNYLDRMIFETGNISMNVKIKLSSK